jgi:hypothetical protein
MGNIVGFRGVYKGYGFLGGWVRFFPAKGREEASFFLTERKKILGIKAILCTKAQKAQ